MRWGEKQTYKKVLTVLTLLAGLYSWYYVHSEFRLHKEDLIIQIADFAHTIALPYRIAKLYRMPPDETLHIPLQGVRREDIADTWGDARSEGRTHEGTDIFAARGTPVYAAAPGYVLRTGTNALGGNIVFTIGAGGVRYYYAHLDAVAKGIAFGTPVTVDTVLGFVGNTGNAEQTPPHLHFGMYTAGGAQNPYSLLVRRD